MRRVRAEWIGRSACTRRGFEMNRTAARRLDRKDARMEALDSRRLLSAAVSGTQLVITGTDARDHVLISVDPADASMLMVNLNGEAQSFPRASITNVSADL